MPCEQVLFLRHRYASPRQSLNTLPILYLLKPKLLNKRHLRLNGPLYPPINRGLGNDIFVGHFVRDRV